MNIFASLFSTQIGMNWMDRTVRGRGNHAARRAIKTRRGLEHILFADEPIYTDRPKILKRGHLLLLCSEHLPAGPKTPQEINWLNEVNSAE